MAEIPGEYYEQDPLDFTQLPVRDMQMFGVPVEYFSEHHDDPMTGDNDGSREYDWD